MIVGYAFMLAKSFYHTDKGGDSIQIAKVKHLAARNEGIYDEWQEILG